MEKLLLINLAESIKGTNASLSLTATAGEGENAKTEYKHNYWFNEEAGEWSILFTGFYGNASIKEDEFYRLLERIQKDNLTCLGAKVTFSIDY